MSINPGIIRALREAIVALSDGSEKKRPGNIRKPTTPLAQFIHRFRMQRGMRPGLK